MPLYIMHKMCDGHHLVFTSEFNPRIDELSPDQLAEQNADWVICSTTLHSVKGWLFISIKLKQSTYGDRLQLQTQNTRKLITLCIQCIKTTSTRQTIPNSLVAKALDLQLAGCEFNSQLRRCRVTTLGKFFTPTCLSRSQWFSDGMIDCCLRGHSQLCLSWQPLRCTALGTGCAPFLQCLGRLSLPPSVGW